MGVWIETLMAQRLLQQKTVTPFVGVWIETDYEVRINNVQLVTPFVGVWIETAMTAMLFQRKRCHTLRGCVD